MQKKLTKSRENKMLCGVCGGIAEYLEVDATIVRLGAALLSVMSCSLGIIAYLIAAIIIPFE